MIDATNATPELFAALATAQASVRTVGKDGRNEYSKYNYATAEGMIRASQGPLADSGLSVVVSHTVHADLLRDASVGSTTPVGRLSAEAILAHSSGGWVTSQHEITIMADKRAPHDKATMAALTYLHGFILRSLLNMDRAEEGSDAVDQRDDTKPDPREPLREDLIRYVQQVAKVREISNVDARKLIYETSAHVAGGQPTVDDFGIWIGTAKQLIAEASQ